MTFGRGHPQNVCVVCYRRPGVSRGFVAGWRAVLWRSLSQVKSNLRTGVVGFVLSTRRLVVERSSVANTPRSSPRGWPGTWLRVVVP